MSSRLKGKQLLQFLISSWCEENGLRDPAHLEP